MNKMSDARAKKTRIRAGHKGVATRRVKEVDELLAAITPGRPADATKLAQLRLSLREKLETISKLDDELFELIDDEGELTSEIDQADIFKQSIYATLVKLDDQLTPKVHQQLCLPLLLQHRHLRAMRDYQN